MFEISKPLLDALRCPESGQALRLASADEIAALNARIAAGGAANRAGEPLSSPVEGGLTREDGAFVYPIRGGFPILLIEESIEIK